MDNIVICNTVFDWLDCDLDCMGVWDWLAQSSSKPLVALLVCTVQLYWCSIIALMSAAIFGNVSSIMLRLYRGAEEYHEQLSSIKEFIKFHYIPKPLSARLIESFQNSRAFNKGIDLNSVRAYFILYKHFELINFFLSQTTESHRSLQIKKCPCSKTIRTIKERETL